MKRTWVYIDGVAYEKGAEPASEGVMVMPDIEPYQSMIDGSMITSRSEHRAHLKQHGCVEVGNEAHTIARNAYKNLPDPTAQSRRELIRAQVDAMTHREFRQAIKRDADRVKWNSNY